MGSCRVFNYFLKLISLRPDKLTIASWGGLASDGTFKGNKLIIGGILAVYTRVEMSIYYFGLFCESSGRKVVEITAILFFHCNNKAKHYELAY